MQINNKILKLFYNTLLAGMPLITSNPYNKNPIHAPFKVKEYSTYINFKLNNNEVKQISTHINKFSNFSIIPASLLNNDEPNYFLSINIYNCTSPIFDFLTNEPATRCEINTYVTNNNTKGTLIIDYVSNLLSVDPDNIFKLKNNINFKKNNNIISGNANNENINLKFNYNNIDNNNIDNNNKIKKLSNDLIQKSEYIFYNNGIYDKLYYDSSLINNPIITTRDFNLEFDFLNIQFNNVDSIFYFENEINFVGGMWYNLYK